MTARPTARWVACLQAADRAPQTEAERAEPSVWFNPGGEFVCTRPCILYVENC